jgi:hypothetical protein
MGIRTGTSPTMKPVLAPAVAALSTVLTVLTVWLAAANPASAGPPLPLAAGILVAMLAFPLTGALLVTRRPENLIGYLFLLVGLGFPLAFGAEEYAVRALVLQPGSLPAGIWMAWISQWSFILWFAPLPIVLLLFPDGRLPSRRWRPVLIVVIFASVAWAVVSAFHPGRLGSGQLAAFSNPVGVEMIGALADVTQPDSLVGLAFLLCALGAITRFRRARGVERQQLKLFAYTAGLIATILAALLLVPLAADVVAMDASGLADVLWITFIASFAAIAIAVTVAILRYRLYDIDLLINRTVVYAATSAAIAVIFFVGIVALQALLRPLTAGSDLSIAASTLASFALFQPVRRRVQGAVDRRFDRARYDAARTLDAFADRLRDEVDLDALRADLLGAVERTMAPAHASVWLRDPASLVTISGRPADRKEPGC